MSLENPTNKNGNRMELEEAQMEANMLRVKIKEMVGHEPTAEDYDNALKAVEEMKKLAEEEPDFDKNFFKLMQVGNKYFQKIPYALVWLLKLGNYSKDQKDIETNEFHNHMFDDAEARLTQLKEKAEKLARSEME